MASSSTSTSGTGAAAAVAPGGDCHTASEINATEVTGSHVLTINGYSRAKRVPRNQFISSSFTLAGHTWSIRYYPNGCGSCDDFFDDYVSVYLTVVPDAMARFSFSLVPEYGISYIRSYGHQYTHMTSEPSGLKKFFKIKELEQSGCLRNNSFKIRCDITMLNVVKHEDATKTSNTTPKFVNVPPSDLVQHLGHLLSSGEGADVMFEVGGETFSAHRSILAARSPVFKAELFSPMKEGTATRVRINDMDGAVFKDLLDFIYTDVFPNVDEGDTMAMAQHLLVAADRYNLERLKLMCEEKLCGYIDISSAGTILTLAEQHGCAGLKKACLDFLMSGNNMSASIVTGGFEHLTNSCPSILLELLAKLTVTSS
ncbi:unnamed protein product [Urochloa decumbens]|uniref:Uncharacterized protein n=1 Tax=Urochloa decumbens TaxID=240449 RepID=A0ABC9AI01_9POAL